MAALMVVLGSSARGAGAAPDAWDAFTFTAIGDALRVTVVEPGAPLAPDVVDPGGLRARAALDALGSSTAVAEVAGPGDALITGLAVPLNLLRANAPAPVAIPALDVPLRVTSDASSAPERSDTQGPLTVGVRSTADRSTGDVGLSGVAEVHTETATGADGTLHGVSSVQVSGLALGPVTIGEFRSRVEVVQRAAGAATTTKWAAVTGLVVNGTEVVLSQGQSYDAPNVHVALLQPTDNDTVASAPELVVRVSVPAALLADATTTVNLVVGRAQVEHTAVAAVFDADTPETVNTDATVSHDPPSPPVRDVLAATTAPDASPPPLPIANASGVTAPSSGFRLVRGPRELTPAGKVALSGIPTALVVAGALAWRRRRRTARLQ
jgi:hypothetical protein